MALNPTFAAMVTRINSNEFEIVGLPNGRRSPPFASRRGAEVWLERNLDQVGLTKAKRGPRACLGCGKTFESEGIHNRMCSCCRSRDDGGSMAIAATSSGKVRRAAGA